MFTGHRNTNSKGFIAIDDITVREGVCSIQSKLRPTQYYHRMSTGSQNAPEIIKVLSLFYSILDVCGFDSSLCDFENDVSHLGRWVHKKGTKHHVDHTYGTENGE